MTCTNSVIHPEGMIPVEGDNETARLGTMVHALAESVVRTGEYDLTPLRNELSDSDFARAMMLTANWLDVWSRIKPFMTDPVVEKYLECTVQYKGEPVTLTGHIDVHQAYSDRAFIVDYKTGRQHENHYHQMAGYAYLVWADQGYPADYTLYVTAVYLEDKTTQSYTFTADSINAWSLELLAKVEDRRFVVGRKCAFCLVQGSCEAYRSYVGGSIAALSAAPHDLKQWEEMDAVDRGELADRMYVVEKAIERAKLGLRQSVRKRGSLDMGKGYQYELVESEERGVNASKAVKVLKRNLPDWEKHARFRLDDILVAYTRNVPRGEKGRAKAALLAELEKAGAIFTAKSTKMYRRPKNEKVLDEATQADGDGDGEEG
jgi:hypothetical protein